MILDFIDPFYFIISFFIGLGIVYMITPFPEVIIRYPTPETAPYLRYKDKDESCYRYQPVQVQCKSKEENKQEDK